MTHDMRPAIAILSADLMLSVRLEDVVTAQGGRPLSTDTPEAFVAAVDAHFPVLALVDLATPGDIPGAIQRCKLRPHTRHTPIYAFGSHVNIAALQAARQAGADHAWARQQDDGATGGSRGQPHPPAAALPGRLG